MTSDTTTGDSTQLSEDTSPELFDNWFDPIENALRDRVRGFIEGLIRDELEGVLKRQRYPPGVASSDQTRLPLYSPVLLGSRSSVSPRSELCQIERPLVATKS